MRNFIHTILNRSIAAPFYRQHAGAFLFLFFILFGIQPSFNDALKTHYAIISGILTSVNFFLIATLCWALYTIKALLFIRSCLQQEAYDFIFQLNGVPQAERFFILLKLISLLLAPITAYSILVVGIAMRDGKFLQGLGVAVFMIMLHMLATLRSYSLIKQGKGLQQVIRSSIRFPLPKNLTTFLLKFVFHRQIITLFIIKILSFSCLYFFVRTEVSVFEERMLWMLFLTSLVGHSVLIYRNFHFMETKLSFYRNLPVKSVATLLSLFIVYLILLLPEAWALRALIFSRGNVAEYIWMILTGPLFLLLLHCLLYTEDMTMEEFLKLLFGVWVVFVFFSLSRNHWLIPAICLCFSPIVFLLSYKKYERNTEVKGLQ